MAIVPSIGASDMGFIDRLALLAADIKVSHSIFALPFGLLATFLAVADDRILPDPVALLLMVLCMVLARTTAMTANRWADATIDRVNPRTAARAIPAGRLNRRFVLGCVGVFALFFVLATGGFWLLDGNVYPLVLSPLVLLWLVGYSFTKRVTWLCHLWLGAALALSPLAAVIAIQPSFLSGPAVYLLALMVMCWVAGFDIIYALQDVQSDRATGVFSMPARLGVNRALWASRLLHVLAVAALVVLWYISPVLHVAFGMGVIVVVVLLIIEHALVWGSKTHQIHMAFFTLNGIISVVLGAMGMIDIVRHVSA